MAPHQPIRLASAETRPRGRFEFDGTAKIGQCLLVSPERAIRLAAERDRPGILGFDFESTREVVKGDRVSPRGIWALVSRQYSFAAACAARRGESSGPGLVDGQPCRSEALPGRASLRRGGGRRVGQWEGEAERAVFALAELVEGQHVDACNVAE